MVTEQKSLLELMYTLFYKYSPPTHSTMTQLITSLVESSFQPVVQHVYHNDETIRSYMLLALLAGLGVATVNPNLTKESMRTLLESHRNTYEITFVTQVFNSHYPPADPD